MTHAVKNSSFIRKLAGYLTGKLVVVFSHLLTGLRSQWREHAMTPEPTLYFGNHTSHGDFVLIWAGLTPYLRSLTRPVAAQDYWQGSRFRNFIGTDTFHALMIRRNAAGKHSSEDEDPVQQMADALEHGQSLIMFPEGTRNTTDAVLLAFKSGLYHLAVQCPNARLVPVWIDNIRRVLPKGKVLPIPLACTVHYGAPMQLNQGEDKAAFLARARQAMLDLRPEHDRRDDTLGNDPDKA